MITFLFAGGKNEADLNPAFNYYFDKLRKLAETQVIFVTTKETTPDKIRRDESEKVIKYLNKSSYTILFDENGENQSSEDYSKTIQNSPFKNLFIIVGGSYGVGSDIKKLSNKTISFGKMIFPHQFARIMTLEQTYRALLISKGSDYHHK